MMVVEREPRGTGQGWQAWTPGNWIVDMYDRDVYIACMFPASAGMNRVGMQKPPRLQYVPRFCGDEPSRLVERIFLQVCSPPMRG